MSIEGDNIKNIENQVEDKPDKSAMADSETSQDTKEDAQNNTETEEEIKNDENEKEDENDSVKSEKDESNGKVESDNDEKDEETNPKEKPKVEKEKSKVVEKKKSTKTENNKSEKSEGEEEDEDEEGEENDDEDNEDKEDDDEEEDDVKPKPGARDRKRVQRFNEDLPEIKEKYEGSGVQLGSITAIDINLSRTKADDLKPLHKLLFKNPGKLNMIKKNIRKFNGFDFTADSEAYTAKVAILNKLEPVQIRSMCSFLDLDKKGSKEELSTKICDYLLCPKDNSIQEDPIDSSQSGRPRRSAAVKAASRRYSDSEDSEDKSPRKRGKGQRATLKDDSSSESDYNPSGSEGSDVGRIRKRPVAWKGGRAKTKRASAVSDQSVSPDDDSEEDSDREPPKQRAGRPGRPQARSAKPAVKKTPAKRGAPAKESEPSESEEDAADSDEEPKKKKGRVVVNNKAKISPANNQKGKKAAPSPAAKGRPQRAATSKPTKHDSSSGSEEESEAESEDEPLVAKTSPKKKSKAQEPPTDADLKTLVKEILDGANLEEITMKTVCKQVYAKYPQFDLAHKKDFIKSTVKSLIST